MQYQSINGTDYRAPDEGGYVRFSAPGDPEYHLLTKRSLSNKPLYVSNQEEFLALVADSPEWAERRNSVTLQDLQQATRPELIEYLELWGFQCYDYESTDELREAAIRIFETEKS